MPLSEEELRLLEQMEQALAQEDPKFVSTLRGSSLERVARLRTFAAAGVFIAGVAMLMGGAVAQTTWLGILGFVVMLGSATVGLAAWRGRHAPGRPAPPQRRGPPLRLRRPPPPLRRDPGRPRPAGPQGASPQRQGGRQARSSAERPQAGHLHAAHGAALGAPAQPGLLTHPDPPASRHPDAYGDRRTRPACPGPRRPRGGVSTGSTGKRGLDRLDRRSRLDRRGGRARPTVAAPSGGRGGPRPARRGARAGRASRAWPRRCRPSSGARR